MDNENKELEAKTNTEIAPTEVGVKETVKPKAAKSPAKPAAEVVAKTATKTAESEAPKVSDAAAEKVGKKILEANADMQEVHVSADGRAFYHKNDADNHARTLKNRVVTIVTR